MTDEVAERAQAWMTRFREAFERPVADPVERDALLTEFVDYLSGYAEDDPPLPGSPIPVTEFNSAYRDEGLDWPSHALTMVGRRRLGNYQALIERVLSEGIRGDLIETGVWRGGASILARAVLKLSGVTNRRVLVADSFKGLPPPDPDQYPADSESSLHEYDELAISLEEVQENFRRFGLLDDQVVFVPGWFRDTMPTLAVERLAIARLDGDMYESTIDPLRHLFDRVTSGGWIIIDDYVLENCARAVHDFFDERAINPELIPIDRVGVYFRKD